MQIMSLVWNLAEDWVQHPKSQEKLKDIGRDPLIFVHSFPTVAITQGHKLVAKQ